ncbi:hypothetical protein F4779DRAFT_584105 [Xylariaceae sp. FL0662B]|nr:hypothetical protein F4779DRAFT_584105 [Xylariaceae sp. FL0662B]
MYIRGTGIPTSTTKVCYVADADRGPSQPAPDPLTNEKAEFHPQPPYFLTFDGGSTNYFIPGPAPGRRVCGLPVIEPLIHSSPHPETRYCAVFLAGPRTCGLITAPLQLSTRERAAELAVNTTRFLHGGTKHMLMQLARSAAAIRLEHFCRPRVILMIFPSRGHKKHVAATLRVRCCSPSNPNPLNKVPSCCRAARVSESSY